MKGHSINEVDGPVFATQIREPRDRRPLFVSFGTVTADMSFSFTNEVKEHIDINKILVRDSSQLFYQRGISPITSNIPETILYLTSLVNDMNPSKVVVFGEAIGAYAALLFGTKLQADEVHAFSPITFLQSRKKIVWKEAHDEMMTCCNNDFFDLKKSLDEIEYPTRIHVYYDSSFDYYNFHAENIQSCYGVDLIKFSFGGHNLVNRLRKSGELSSIIDKALEDQS